MNNGIELKKEAFFLASITLMIALYKYWRFFDSANTLNKVIYGGSLGMSIFILISVLMQKNE